MKIAHLCITYNHLMFALATSKMLHNYEHTIFMPIDYQFVPELVRKKLESNFHKVNFVFSCESSFIKEFSTFPRFFPNILKRNLAFHGFHLISPFGWKSFQMNNKFDLFYTYHSGPFLSKVLSGCSKKTILRGDGFANYKQQKVGILKGCIRFIFGLPFSKQVWGEERWIDEIEVVEPSLLPNKIVVNKSSKLNIEHIVSICKEDDFKQAIVNCFSIDFLSDNYFDSSVIFLSQPLDNAKLCSTNEMIRINNLIIDFFDRKGFKVYVKQHPREADINYLNACMLPRTVPIEIFSLLGINFHYAVSLHSAGIQDEFVIAKIQKNLVPLRYFDADHFHLWEDIVVKGLDEMME